MMSLYMLIKYIILKRKSKLTTEHWNKLSDVTEQRDRLKVEVIRLRKLMKNY